MPGGSGGGSISDTVRAPGRLIPVLPQHKPPRFLEVVIIEKAYGADLTNRSSCLADTNSIFRPAIDFAKIEPRIFVPRREL